MTHTTSHAMHRRLLMRIMSTSVYINGRDSLVIFIAIVAESFPTTTEISHMRAGEYACT
jgi:hypothetical protein